MTKLWTSIAAGAVAGAAGVAVMNAYQSAINAASKAVCGRPALNLDDAATRDVANAVSQPFSVVQYGVGSVLGALYGLSTERIPAISAGAGTAFGAAAWLVGDEIAVPLLGIANGPEYRSFSGHVNALAGHVVFGAAAHCARAVLLRSLDGVSWQSGT